MDFIEMCNSAPALAERAHAEIERVVAVSLGSKGFRYEAVKRDGSREVIRKSANWYGFATLYPGAANSGKSGLGAVFKFGQKPGQPDWLFGQNGKHAPLNAYEIQ